MIQRDEVADAVVRRACDMRDQMIYALAERQRAGELSADEAAAQREALEAAHYFPHSVRKVMVSVPLPHRQYAAEPIQILLESARVHHSTREGEFLPFTGNAGAILIW